MTRKATKEDFDFIFKLHIDPQVNRYLFYKIMPANEFRIIFDKLLQQGVLYVYEEDSIVKGMFKLMPETNRAAHVVHLGGVAIDPLFAGQGCGQRMLAEIVQLGKENGFIRMQLGVSEANTKAIYLYAKAGFVKEGALKKYIYLENEDIYLDDVLMAYLYE